MQWSEFCVDDVMGKGLLQPAQVKQLIEQWHAALADDNCSLQVSQKHATQLMTQLRKRLIEVDSPAQRDLLDETGCLAFLV